MRKHHLTGFDRLLSPSSSYLYSFYSPLYSSSFFSLFFSFCSSSSFSSLSLSWFFFCTCSSFFSTLKRWFSKPVRTGLSSNKQNVRYLDRQLYMFLTIRKQLIYIFLMCNGFLIRKVNVFIKFRNEYVDKRCWIGSDFCCRSNHCIDVSENSNI